MGIARQSGVSHSAVATSLKNKDKVKKLFKALFP